MTTKRGAPLSDAQVKAFYDIGHLILEDVFRPHEIAEMGAAFDRLREEANALETPQMRRGAYFVVQGKKINRIVWCGAAEPVLLDYGADPRLMAPAAQLLGSDEMEQLICQAHFKLPDDGVSFHWHQDSEHRRYGTEEWNDVNGQGSYVQTFVAIDEMTEENGPLLVVPGSCRLGHQYLNLKSPDVEPAPPDSVMPVTLARGSVLLLSPYTIHGSQPNRSTNPRRLFINGYAYPGANRRVYPGEGSGRRLRLGNA